MKHISILALLFFFSCKEKQTTPEWLDESSYNETEIDQDTMFYYSTPEFTDEHIDTSLLTAHSVADNETQIITGHLQKKGQKDSTEFLLIAVNTNDNLNDNDEIESSEYTLVLVIKDSPSLEWLLGFKKSTETFNYELLDDQNFTQLEFGTIVVKKLNKIDVITKIKNLLEKNETKFLSVKLL